MSDTTSGAPVPVSPPPISDLMEFLLANSMEGARKRIAELEADRRRIELLDDPVFAPNLHIGCDDDGEMCWMLGDEGIAYATVRAALDSINEDESDAE